MSTILMPHEWLAVGLVLATVGGFTCFSWNHYSESLPIDIAQEWSEQELHEEKIEVEIEGAVEHPGAYLVESGARLGTLLDLAKPLPEADLHAMRRNQKLRHHQHVHIDERPWITIYLSGAVKQAGAHRIREGTLLLLLPEVCPLHPQAELKGLKSKRRLVDQEHIHIPFQPKN